MEVERVIVPGTHSVPPEGTRGHMYRTGAWTPINEEVVQLECEVIQGAIPTDLSGVYIRNTENPCFDSKVRCVFECVCLPIPDRRVGILASAVAGASAR
jgi:hypothetical protein